VYYFISLQCTGKYEAIGKRKVDRIAITNCKQVTGGMTWVELLTRLCFVHASSIVGAICVTVFLMGLCLTTNLANDSRLYPDYLA